MRMTHIGATLHVLVDHWRLSRHQRDHERADELDAALNTLGCDTTPGADLRPLLKAYRKSHEGCQECHPWPTGDFDSRCCTCTAVDAALGGKP